MFIKEFTFTVRTAFTDPGLQQRQKCKAAPCCIACKIKLSRYEGSGLTERVISLAIRVCEAIEGYSPLALWAEGAEIK